MVFIIRKHEFDYYKKRKANASYSGFAGNWVHSLMPYKHGIRVSFHIEDESGKLIDISALGDPQKEVISKIVDVIYERIQNEKCAIHPKALKSIVVFYAVKTKEYSITLYVCCRVFAIYFENIFKDVELPINITCLRQFDQSEQN